jgi:hypothetical protein
MSAPTPRTDAAWSASFEGKQLSAGQTAQALRDCSQQLERELATITAERAELRAEVARLRAGIEVCLRTNGHLADGENCTLIGLKHCLRDARAERAEAELATEREKAERYRLTTLKLDAELAKEREKVRVLREALENLRDEQNGAPLCAREEQWKQAMDKADAALATTEDAK